MQYAFSFVMRGEQKMEGERFSFEMPHFTVMADETPKTCIMECPTSGHATGTLY